MQENIIRQYGYTTVDAFMMLYWNTKNAKDAYEKKLSDWTDKYGDYSERDIKSQKGIKERIQDGKKRMRDNDKISNVTRKKSIER